jgi:hypothetical protein
VARVPEFPVVLALFPTRVSGARDPLCLGADLLHGANETYVAPFVLVEELDVPQLPGSWGGAPSGENHQEAFLGGVSADDVPFSTPLEEAEVKLLHHFILIEILPAIGAEVYNLIAQAIRHLDQDIRTL